MSQTAPREYRLKTGQTLTVRTATPDDAQAVLEHARTILAEDLYNIGTLEEFKITIDAERPWIRKLNDHPARIILVAVLAPSLAGMLYFENSSRKRLTHRGTLHMNVHPDFRHIGVGTALLQSLIDWARQNPIIEKVRLSVFAENSPAIALYKKMGFLEEGRRLREIKIADGKYSDQILMCRFVEK